MGTCAGCGHLLPVEGTFCGVCGSARELEPALTAPAVADEFLPAPAMPAPAAGPTPTGPPPVIPGEPWKRGRQRAPWAASSGPFAIPGSRGAAPPLGDSMFPGALTPFAHAGIQAHPGVRFKKRHPLRRGIATLLALGMVGASAYYAYLKLYRDDTDPRLPAGTTAFVHHGGGVECRLSTFMVRIPHRPSTTNDLSAEVGLRHFATNGRIAMIAEHDYKIAVVVQQTVASQPDGAFAGAFMNVVAKHDDRNLLQFDGTVAAAQATKVSGLPALKVTGVDKTKKWGVHTLVLREGQRLLTLTVTATRGSGRVLQAMQDSLKIARRPGAANCG
ncbi:MAG TPA: zinc ribbon domain-containing protein [Acidimicrobiia bacterium]|nr:zinc ribbon domain-containing protein [Acidimicrobiia bacterium]